MTTIASIIDSIFPTANSTGVILSSPLWVIFDREIDEGSVNMGNFFVEGPDTDTTIGPDMGLNLPNTTDSYSGDQFESPGYAGIVPGTITFEKIQLSEISAYSGFDPAGSGGIWRTKVIFTPTYRLAPTTVYTIYISGDEDEDDTTATGIRARSIFDAYNGSNSGTGEVTFEGTFIGTGASDTFVVQIDTAGVANTAKFNWWRASDPSFIHGPIVSDINDSILLEEGVSINFGDGTFAVGDTFSVLVRRPELFTGNMYWSFTTGSGSIQSVPATASTSITGSSTSLTPSTFVVSKITPKDKATNQLLSTAVITLEFNSTVDPTTVTDETVSIEGSPVNGDETGLFATRKIYKDITVDGNKIILTIQ